MLAPAWGATNTNDGIVGKAVGKAAKAVGKVLAKFNPVSLMIRGGLLLAIRTNMFKLADKLQYGLYTDEQAQAAGFNMDLFHDNQQSYKKALNVFTKLQGNESKFRAAIQKGVKHKAIKGVSGLGMLTGLGWIATAATVVSAMSAIIGILSFFKGKKNPMGEEYADEPVSEDAIKSAMDAAGNLDEDGNPIDSEGNIIDDAANVVNNVVNKVQDYLPSGGGSSDDGGGNDNNVYDAEPSSLPVKKAAAPKVIGENIPELRKSAMDVIKENAKPIAIGAGILGLAAAFFLLRRKKTKSAGLSGVRTSKRRSYNKLETIKLS
ncbi:hypothetical protein FACS189464_1690 [Bacteroidia bacterium]|nr:hypothetical protein FACS189464_1690 [Bacteroidia bacterium]